LSPEVLVLEILNANVMVDGGLIRGD
jgi:hypothetical protein